MYNQKDIREVLEELLDNENTNLSDFKNAIVDFYNKVENKEIFNCVFRGDEFEEICVLASIDDAHNYPYNEESYDEMLKVFETFFDLDIDGQVKKKAIFAFVRNFAHCSDDEDFCDNKVYVLIKNLSSDDSGVDWEKEYDSLDDAITDIDDIYTGCCDDSYLAECMWFQILCYLQSNEWDTCINFCKVFEFNVAGIEEGREYWEAENCDFGDCDDFDDEDED